ncbi:ATP-binding protein [Streptomyces canus]|uniref:ATP-binding protein n=1 Tax=Streptomyces canus TaxID=58343 RepID=UPI003CEACA40
MLVTGQLAANAVGHGRSRVSVDLTLAASTLLISVADRGSRPEARRPEDVRPGLDSGRGLHMVGALSHRPRVRRARERIHRSSADVRRRDSYRAEAVLWAGQAPSASRTR